MGKIGGQATVRKYGKDYMRELGRKGGAANAKVSDMRELGRKGGAITSERYGKQHYVNIGKIGGSARKNVER